jgi:hypothetical protein
MTTFRILALDPGGVTGWATYTALRMITPNSLHVGQKISLPFSNDLYEYFDEEWSGGQLGEFNGKKWAPKKHHNDLETLLGMQHVQDFTVVCESFEYRNESPSGLVLMSREYIGVVERFCQERNVPLVMQKAAVGKVTKKSFVRKENLERLGLWVKGGASTWNHMMDADGHLLQYMIRNNIRKQYLLETGWPK